jgi:predicted Fe-Mo cluster-binding NifX family protein
LKIAIPLTEHVLCAHFGLCEHFGIYGIDDNEIKDTKVLTPPAHQPGVLPNWLKERGVDVIIASGMGGRAQDLFKQQGIEVVCGAASLDPEGLIRQYLDGTLITGTNICNRH